MKPAELAQHTTATLSMLKWGQMQHESQCLTNKISRIDPLCRHYSPSLAVDFK
jgi:hypothetical protein